MGISIERKSGFSGEIFYQTKMALGEL